MRNANVVTHYSGRICVGKRCSRISCIYCADWTHVLGEELTAERELGNLEDPFSLKKTVGHVPRDISKIYWLIIHRGSLTDEVYNTVQNGGHQFRMNYHTLTHDRAISTVIVRGSNNSRL